ncbi:MAG: serine protein kinase [Nanoarchaeota archaeon]|nr:serine protein kinase [Nanoarchaeota archaeon]
MVELEDKLFEQIGADSREEYAQITKDMGFFEYLRMLHTDARPARTSFQRMCDMIEGAGITKVQGAYEDFVRYEFFTPMDANQNPTGDALFGLEKPLMKLVGKIRNAATERGAERRLILLHGPVGSAKSTIAKLIKRGLERYSRTDPLYTISWTGLEGREFDGKALHNMVCEMREEPLHLLPEEGRQAVIDAINSNNWLKEGSAMKYPAAVRGNLCPQCSFNLEALIGEYKGDWKKAVEQHVRVVRWLVSEKAGRGIGTFQPKDEKNQDSTDLTGDINFRRIAEYGSDSDPRVFNFDGEFCKANRGLIEFIEMLKLETAFLYDLLEATQDKVIKPKKFAKTDIDLVIIGHTNPPDLRKLQSDEFMEALRDRTIKIDIPYNLRLKEEVNVCKKGFVHDIKHIAPHTFEAAALWALLTRMETPKEDHGKGLTLRQKISLYDGQQLPDMTADVVRKMMKDAEKEGLFGISPRMLQDAIGDAAAMYDEPCINPYMVLTMIEERLKHSVGIDKPETRLQYLSLIDEAKTALSEWVQRDVSKAQCGPEQVERYAKRYLENVSAWVSGELVEVPEDPLRKVPPNERFMKAIEDQAEITPAHSKDFRKNLMQIKGTLASKGKQISVADNETLRKGIEGLIFEENKNNLNLNDLFTGNLDSIKAGKKKELIKALEDLGYCEHCMKAAAMHSQDKMGQAAEN